MDTKISSLSKVADIVTKHPETRVVFEKMSIDYCCGGEKSLIEACQKAEVPLPEIVEKLQKTIEESRSIANQTKDWTKVSISELAEHIVNRHHAYLREQFPRLKNLADKVCHAHKKNHGPILSDLNKIFENLRTDIEMHLLKEEQILFPMIKEIEAFAAGKGPKPTVHCGTVENPIRQMKLEHDAAGNLLAQMRNITQNYELPDDACESFKALYEGLQELEEDLHEHIHLENNILFPKSIKLENAVNI